MSLLQEELDQQQRLIQALLRRKVCVPSMLLLCNVPCEFCFHRMSQEKELP